MVDLPVPQKGCGGIVLGRARASVRGWLQCAFFGCLLCVNALLVCLLFCSVCSDVLHTVLGHGVEVQRMYTDFRRVVISGQFGT